MIVVGIHTSHYTVVTLYTIQYTHYNIILYTCACRVVVTSGFRTQNVGRYIYIYILLCTYIRRRNNIWSWISHEDLIA